MQKLLLLFISGALLLLSCSTSKDTVFNTCPIIGVTYEDTPYDSILTIRMWSMIDWCKYDGGVKGLTYIAQVVKVDDPLILPRKINRKQDAYFRRYDKARCQDR